MFVLDSDTLSLLHKGHPEVCRREEAIPDSEIAITVITWIEALAGRFEFVRKAATGKELLRAQSRLDVTRQALERIEVVFPVDEAAAAEFDRLRANKKLRKIGRSDLLIASITLANDATLATRNLKHFRQVPGLKLENWAD